MTQSTLRTTTKELAKHYEPTPLERAGVEAYFARKNGRKNGAAPRMKVSAAKKEGRTTVEIAPDHPDLTCGQVLLMNALGTCDLDFTDRILKHLCNVCSQGQNADEHGLNFMLAVVKGIEPKDQLEATLAAQMAAVHNATMTFARRLNHVENIPQQDSAERAFNKLARTCAAQMEALKRYRSGGEQTVRVEHVTVNEGGQAIVGSAGRQA